MNNLEIAYRKVAEKAQIKYSITLPLKENGNGTVEFMVSKEFLDDMVDILNNHDLTGITAKIL
jgi:hypothetical protein